MADSALHSKDTVHLDKMAMVIRSDVTHSLGLSYVITDKLEVITTLNPAFQWFLVMLADL